MRTRGKNRALFSTLFNFNVFIFNFADENTEIIVDMRKLYFFQIFLVLILFFLCSGCNENVTNGGAAGQYNLQGGLVKNLDIDSASISLSLIKGDTELTDADVRYDGNMIAYDSAQTSYIMDFDSSSRVSAGLHRVKLTDLPWLNDSVLFTVPNNCIITSIQLPEDRVNPGGIAVQIQWSVSLESDGYAYGVVLRDSAYVTEGFSAFVPLDEGNSTSIPPDAFRLSGNVSYPDTGWYYVYVYSYSGSPASERNLPTAIPEGLTDNISKPNFNGRFGSIVVTGRDSIYVVLGE